MKQIFTLIIIGLVTLSLSGQNLSQTHTRLVNNRLQPGGSVQLKAIVNNPDMARHPVGPFIAGNGKQQDNPLTAMQQLDSEVNQQYDTISMQWVNYYKNEFTYNSSGQNTSTLFSSWNSTINQYKPSEKQEFSFDVNGHMTEEVISSWDTTSSQFVNLLKWDYSYDGNGNMTTGYSYLWDNTSNSWMEMGKDEYTYNSNNKVTLEISYYWNMMTSQWMNNNKTENTYNGSGNITLSTYYTWDFIGNQWVNSSKTEYTYDGNAFLTEEVSYQWNTTSNQWVNDLKDDYTYDSNMNMILDTESKWDGMQWGIDLKDEYTYDNSYTYSQLILPWFFGQTGNDFQHMLTGITEYDGSSMVAASKSTLNYSEVNITGLVENVARPARVFPQPASGQVTFSWGNNEQLLRLTISDVNGKKVMDRQIENKGLVSVAHLASGLYFYSLTDGLTTVFTGKMSVR